MVRIDRDNFMRNLREYRSVLPKQIIKTKRGQALSGNLKGAKKGLRKALVGKVDKYDRA